MSIWARPELEYLQKRAGCHTETGRTKKSSAGNQTWRCNDPTGIHEEIKEIQENLQLLLALAGRQNYTSGYCLRAVRIALPTQS